jgi:hypothetical protein
MPQKSHVFSKSVYRAGVSSLLLAQTLLSFGAEPAKPPPLGISIIPTETRFEVGQRAACAFEITNLTSETIALPAFDPVPRKLEDAAAAGYIKAQILKIHVWQGTRTFEMNPEWQTPNEQPPKYGVVLVQPGQAIRESVSLTRNGHPSFFTLTNPGLYSVSVTLDTQGCKDERIPKGIWTSAPATLRIVPYPDFRARQRGESPEAYAQARAAFYLGRIVQPQGEYFANVWSVLGTEGAGAALIDLMDSREPGIARGAADLLGQIHHREGAPGAQPTPASKADWLRWWQETGSKLAARDLFSNFDSHFP